MDLTFPSLPNENTYCRVEPPAAGPASSAPVSAPVVLLMVGKISHYLRRVLAPSLWSPDFWTISSMSLPITHTIHGTGIFTYMWHTFTLDECMGIVWKYINLLVCMVSDCIYLRWMANALWFLCMVHIPFVPCHASWVVFSPCVLPSSARWKWKVSWRRRSWSVISGGPLAGQLRVLEKKGAQIGCLGVLRGLYIVLSNYIGLIS